MKKISYLLLSILFVLAACSRAEDDLAGGIGDMFKLTVGTENNAGTRAVAPELSGYTARYILEIYNNGKRYNRIVQATNEFNFRLITNQEYDFLIWVDYTTDGRTDLYYNTEDSDKRGLKNITITDAPYLNHAHSRDAFFGVKRVSVESSSMNFGEILCKRPFGRLDIKTTDWSHTSSLGTNAKLKPSKINMKFKAPTAFNVFSGEVSGTEDYTYDYDLLISEDDVNDEQNFTCDYIFARTFVNQVTPENVVVSPVIIFFDKDNNEITNTANYLDNLPIQRNFVTKVSGNLITKLNKVNITVDATWSEPPTDIESPEAGKTSLYVHENDLQYNKITGEYTVDSKLIPTGDTDLILIFHGPFTDGGVNKIKIVLPADLPSTIKNVYIDANMTTLSPDIMLADNNFSGMVTLGHYLPTNDLTTIADLTISLPNGSFTIGSGVTVDNMSVLTKSSTFFLTSGAVVLKDLSIRGGRAKIEGEVKGAIFVYGDSDVEIVKNGTMKRYSTSAITQKGVSKWYGFGVGVNDLVGLALPGFTMPDFLDLSFNMNYAGAYAAFDFNNQSNGLNWRDFRNVDYTFVASDGKNGSARLKKELSVTYSTPAELEAAMNKPVKDLKAALNSKVAQVDAMVNEYNKMLPAKLSAALKAEVAKLKVAVNYFNTQLPVVNMPEGPAIPLATILPAADNFDFSEVAKLIGKPGDKFNLLDIGSYINGSKSLSVYMIIDLLTNYSQAEGTAIQLKAQKAALENEKATLNAEKSGVEAELSNIKTTPGYIDLTNQLNVLVAAYDALPAPSVAGFNGGVWAISPAIKNPLFATNGGNYFTLNYTKTGNPDATNLGKMNAKNAKIVEIEAKVDARDAYYQSQAGAKGDRIKQINARIKVIDEKINGTLGQFFTDGLNAQILAADGQVSIFEGVFTQLGLPVDTVNTIVDVILTVEPYLATVADVANTINDTMVKIQSYNPWEYPSKVSSKATIQRMEVKATFEYETGKKLYLFNQ